MRCWPQGGQGHSCRGSSLGKAVGGVLARASARAAWWWLVAHLMPLLGSSRMVSMPRADNGSVVKRTERSLETGLRALRKASAGRAGEGKGAVEVG